MNELCIVGYRSGFLHSEGDWPPDMSLGIRSWTDYRQRFRSWDSMWKPDKRGRWYGRQIPSGCHQYDPVEVRERSLTVSCRWRWFTKKIKLKNICLKNDLLEAKVKGNVCAVDQGESVAHKSAKHVVLQSAPSITSPDITSSLNKIQFGGGQTGML